MAEPFSIVAGAIGIASAVSVIDKISELAHQLRSVKDLPDDLQELTMETNNVSDILKIFRETWLHKSWDRTKMANIEPMVDRCVFNLSRIEKPLEKCLELLNEGKKSSVKAKFIWKSYRAARLKQQMEGHLRDIHRRLDELHFALSLQQSVILFAQSNDTVTVNPAQDQVVRIEKRTLGRPKSWSINRFWFILGTVYSLRTEPSYRDDDYHTAATTRYNLDWRIDINLANWLGGQAFSLLSTPPGGLAKNSLSAVCLRDWKHPLFRACWVRDIHAVRRILSDGTGSVFDVTPRGDTALHIAALVACPELCQLLIDHGARCDAVTTGRWAETPLSYLATSAGIHCYNMDPQNFVSNLVLIQTQFYGAKAMPASRLDVDKTLRVLVAQASCDPMKISSSRKSIFTCWSGQWESMQWLRHSYDYPGLLVDVIGADNGSISLISPYYDERLPETPNILLKVILEPDIVSLISKPQYNGYITNVLCDAFYDLFQYLRSLELFRRPKRLQDDEGYQSRQQVISLLLDLGANIYSEWYGYGHTLLQSIFTRQRTHCFLCQQSGCATYNEQLRNDFAQWWMAKLRAMGVDLHEYCRREAQGDINPLGGFTSKARCPHFWTWIIEPSYVHHPTENEVYVSCDSYAYTTLDNGERSCWALLADRDLQSNDQSWTTTWKVTQISNETMDKVWNATKFLKWWTDDEDEDVNEAVPPNSSGAVMPGGWED